MFTVSWLCWGYCVLFIKTAGGSEKESPARLWREVTGSVVEKYLITAGSIGVSLVDEKRDVSPRLDVESGTESGLPLLEDISPVPD